MKSRVSISINEANKPYIKIEYQASDDVRDLLVKKFLEGFENQSSWAKYSFHPNGDFAMIEPLSLYQMEQEELKIITEQIRLERE